jgi:hypothetical protein
MVSAAALQPRHLRYRLDERAACPACRLTPPPGDVIMELRSGHRRLRDDPVEIALDTPHRLLEPIDVP